MTFIQLAIQVTHLSKSLMAPLGGRERIEFQVAVTSSSSSPFTCPQILVNGLGNYDNGGSGGGEEVSRECCEKKRRECF